MTAEAEPDTTFDLTRHLPYLFNHIQAQLEGASVGQLSDFGVTDVVWRILAVLWTYDDVTHRELAQLTSIEVSTLSRLSKAVQADGLIRRKRTPEDQRTVRVTLTDKGRNLANRIIPSVIQSQHAMFAGLSANEIKTLVRLLHKVVENLNRYGEADVASDDDAVAAAPVEPPKAPTPRKRAAKAASPAATAKPSASPT